MDTAVDEIIRYVSPVLTFIRTVTEDHTYRDTELKKGDRVLMLYASANRDERGHRPPRRARPHPLQPTTWRSGSASTTASAPTWPAWRSRPCSRSCSPACRTSQVPEGVQVPRGDSSLVLALQDMPATFTKCPVAH